jgi:hypothetical protein
MKFGPLPPAPSTVKFFLHTTMSGGTTALTHFYQKYTNAISQGDAITLLNTVSASWNTRIAPLTTNNWTLTQVSLNDLGSRTGVESGLVTSHPGSVVASQLGAAVSFIMSGKTALKYRGGHARVYIPGIASTQSSDSNTWSSTGQGAVSTAWTGMLSDLQSSPPAGVGALSTVTVRYISSNKADFPTPPNPFEPPYLLATPMVLPITAWVSNPQFASQRRRNQQ